MKDTAELIRDLIERDARSFDEMSDAIWDFAEYRFQETRSCEIQKKRRYAFFQQN